MANGEFNVTYPVGGRIDLVKKIGYPEALLPDGVNTPKLKTFRLECIDATPVSFTFTPPVSGVPVYLSAVGVTPQRNEDPDYWELEVGAEKVCETMYTMQLTEGEILPSNFEILMKVEEGEDIVFTFYNDSGYTKIVWATVEYVYQKI